MGKKACLALDLDYDGDEIYGDYFDDVDNEGYKSSKSKTMYANQQQLYAKSPPPTNASNNVAVNPLTLMKKPTTSKHRMTSCTLQNNDNDNISTQPQQQMLHYVPNPHRRPLFKEHIALNDGLLYNVVSYLDMNDVIQLSMVSKLVQISLSVDGLYCKNDIDGTSKKGKEGYGILLPCLWGVRHRLLPLLDNNLRDGNIRRRQGGISRLFAYECLAFSNESDSASSFKGTSFASTSPSTTTIRPKTIISMNTPNQVNTISFCSIQWEETSFLKRKSIKRRSSGIRLSYVTNESNNCSLITVWIGSNNHPMNEDSNKQYAKERYLPPNTKKILQASIHSDLCAILSTPLDCSRGYILSMVTLPCEPTEIFDNGISKNKHSLKWQKVLPSENWQLFSSSEIQPIVSFSNQGTHVIFGSTERFGIVDCDTGSQLWTLFDARDDMIELPSSSLLQMKPMYAEAYANAEVDKCQNTATTTSTINAYLLHHEFLFTLENNGILMRVYDVTSTWSNEALAEGRLPWSFTTKTTNEKQAQGLVRRHHKHQRHSELARDEFQLTFCAGRIWVTGQYNSDLLCSSPPRLLRRLRSRLPTLSSSGSNGSYDILSLRFIRMKTDLHLNTPNPMHTWNDTHLYIVDGNRIYCWRLNNSKSGTNSGNQIITIYDADNEYIESINVDGTKVIVCTNETFRNTTTRDWDGSGNVWVVPIDVSQPTAVVSSMRLQVYHKKIFSVKQFSGIVANNGSRSTSRHPVSSSSNCNYQLVDMSSDGRYVLVQCKKGLSAKSVVLDLYRHEKHLVS